MAGSLVEGRHEFSVPIDSAVDGVMFSVSLQCLESVDVLKPRVTWSRTPRPESSINFVPAESSRCRNPNRASGGCACQATAWAFSWCRQRATRRSAESSSSAKGGRPGHEGLFPTHAPPRAGVPQLLAIEINGTVSDVRARLVTSAFEQVAAFPLRESSSSADDHEFVVAVTPPATAFRVVVSGVDGAGWPFQRVHAPLFEPAPR
ncbi:MAG: hypothetical protein AUJ01_14295 [Acidobacteria bacterium 13_1_40CM_3_65_5]|nr:MAG: hypothetical protein AUJ01_14295 [Acidobacteria bacterium 13_1_40CM_3_65_5]OLE79762.1 MAG: hypothetical protein AUF76_16010 [Acidobacteria bacterium 13_1_20CM_2_65_9]